MWVDPHLSLMLVPFGSLWMTWVSAPRASKTDFATEDAEPFEQSRATFLPLKLRVASEMR